MISLDTLSNKRYYIFSIGSEEDRPIKTAGSTVGTVWL